ncbi:integral membrane protein [Lactobacillus plantarum JDM1] [Lactiplantibacillus mudanjiangensis]|uniref:threonine/serine exporter family protein n=1 Tax=Lactiplantibacillus mudanjiangensis TaxID=1296538 RepID=UPI0010141ECB|nr:threonine/serine exporter family protein [Lactiplantibacillus mudanjiangensis]VDG21311.1 integral membrane protein [Lactobacillus plantarum JDM1] [Lactiplantibacillus mudanjiangensis]VDG32144.1 integral membrane protein [Lactobacillus plantarum JDM1] [Lactiplantibacillus mudanjiangensis]
MGHWLVTTGLLQTLLAYLATAGFGVLLNIPRRAVNLSGWVGAAGWLTYEVLFQLLPTTVDIKLAIGNLVAAVVIGVASGLAARYKQMPMIIFNIPSLVPLVPGGQAYRVVRNLVTGHPQLATHYLSQVVIIAGVIAIGFLIAEFCNHLFLHFSH